MVDDALLTLTDILIEKNNGSSDKHEVFDIKAYKEGILFHFLYDATWKTSKSSKARQKARSDFMNLSKENMYKNKKFSGKFLSWNKISKVKIQTTYNDTLNELGSNSLITLPEGEIYEKLFDFGKYSFSVGRIRRQEMLKKEFEESEIIADEEIRNGKYVILHFHEPERLERLTFPFEAILKQHYSGELEEKKTEITWLIRIIHKIFGRWM